MRVRTCVDTHLIHIRSGAWDLSKDSGPREVLSDRTAHHCKKVENVLVAVAGRNRKPALGERPFVYNRTDDVVGDAPGLNPNLQARKTCAQRRSIRVGLFRA
jgi:hypothetical protein